MFVSKGNCIASNCYGFAPTFFPDSFLLFGFPSFPLPMFILFILFYEVHKILEKVNCALERDRSAPRDRYMSTDWARAARRSQGCCGYV